MRSYPLAPLRLFLKWMNISLFAMIGLLALPVFTLAQPAPLSVQIRAHNDGIQFVLHNTSTETLEVLRWETPLENELTNDVFDVVSTDNNTRAIYSGRQIKRGNPTAQDYIQLEPGAYASKLIPINNYYTLPKDGMHRVRFNGTFKTIPTSSQKSLSYKAAEQTSSIQTPSVNIHLDQAPVPSYAIPDGYRSCNAAQEAELATDLDTAVQITTAAHSALANLPLNERASSPRYLKWFGIYDTMRYEKVTGIYARAAQTMQNSIEFDCSCNDPFYAYVFPSDPYKIYLCRAYWTAPRIGSDSRSGTILHELSHFPEVGNTSDSAYGLTRAANLARLNPAAATSNADSIEYFAENSPFLAISAGTFGPTQPIVYEALALDTEIAGTLGLDQRAYYVISGAGNITLRYATGDADLTVYSSSARDNVLCQSRVGNQIESCDITTSADVYIEVHGYAASQYTLMAQAPVSIPPTRTELPVVTTQGGSNAICTDTAPIGDGWGWNGSTSCQINVIATGTCVDPDGDGWGWDGTNTCRTGQEETRIENGGGTISEARCIDEDGDGWGWNGTGSCLANPSDETPNVTISTNTCIDPDGDGWGWNGLSSCQVGETLTSN